MRTRSAMHIGGLVAGFIFLLSSGVTAQEQKNSVKDLIAGNWTLMIADDVSSDGQRVPGFGPLPEGTAKFDADGRYSLTLKRSSSDQPTLTSMGTYTLDDGGKTLTFKVEDSSLPSWRGQTQRDTILFVTGDHLGWSSSAPLIASGNFTGAEFMWKRVK
jgi:hypothetical protein